VTTDLGKDQARTNDAVPRQRGGAHAATKTRRFRRRGAPAPAPRTPDGPVPASPDGPFPGPTGIAVPFPREAGPPSSLKSRHPQDPWHPQEPRQTQEPASGTHDRAAPVGSETEDRALAGPRAAAVRSAAVAGLVAGYLAAGAVQLRALTSARTGPAVHAALVTAAGHWALVTAAITGAVALALACTPGRGRQTRPGARPDDTSGRPPVPGAGGILDHG
jgi:hypothetical protein